MRGHETPTFRLANSLTLIWTLALTNKGESASQAARIGQVGVRASRRSSPATADALPGSHWTGAVHTNFRLSSSPCALGS